MKLTIIISILCLILMMVNGCNTTQGPIGCVVGDKTVMDVELCDAIFNEKMEWYENGKSENSCSDEVKSKIYQQSYDYYVAEESRDFKRECLLIITNGTLPQQNEWYTNIGDTQFDNKNLFPIRTLDIELDQIEAYDGDKWRYWVSCND